jgi:hypothetical protein
MTLSNRDIASLFWLAVLAVLVMSRAGGRAGIASILRALWGKLLALVLAYWAFLALVVVVAWKLGFWSPDLMKDTVLWALIPGLALIFSFVRAGQERGFYVRTLRRLVGLTAIVEFYVNLGSFPLPVELALVPVVGFLVVMSAFAALSTEYTIVKRWADRLLGVIGLAVIVGNAGYLASAWASLDTTRLVMQFMVPVWLTAVSLPFVFVFSLYANYESHFVRFDWMKKDDARARRRAKLALLLSYGLRNHELAAFSGRAISDLGNAKSWREARRVITYRRAEARVEKAKKELAAARLVRYEGVQGEDWDGRPYDEREFAKTKDTLNFMAGVQRTRAETGRYRADLRELLKGTFPRDMPESEFVITVSPDRRRWAAWRRTIGGWYLGIGAAESPPDQWTYLSGEEPQGLPTADGGWRKGDFATTMYPDTDEDIDQEM